MRRRAAIGAALLVLGAAVVVVVMVVRAGRDDRRPLPQPVVTAADGVGSFDGHGNPTVGVTSGDDQAQCTEIPASPADPLTHELQLSGTFHGGDGSGSATFSRDSPSYQSLEGSYADPVCANPSSLTGTMTVVFEPLRCSGTGTYEHRNVTDYTLDFEGTCDDTTTGPVETISTNILLQGVQTVCLEGFARPCGATSPISGTYDQT